MLWAKVKFDTAASLSKLKPFRRYMILYVLIIMFLYLMVVGFTVQRYFLMGRLCWLLGYFFFIFQKKKGNFPQRGQPTGFQA